MHRANVGVVLQQRHPKIAGRVGEHMPRFVGSGRRLGEVAPKAAPKIYSVQGDIGKILESGRIWGQTEGSVYGMTYRNAPKWKSMSKSILEDPGVVVFEGQAAGLFKPHPIDGGWGAMKSGLGQYKAKFGDIVFTEAPIVTRLPNGQLQLVVHSAEVGPHVGQSMIFAYGRLWTRRGIDLASTGAVATLLGIGGYYTYELTEGAISSEFTYPNVSPHLPARPPEDAPIIME